MSLTSQVLNTVAGAGSYLASGKSLITDSRSEAESRIDKVAKGIAIGSDIANIVNSGSSIGSEWVSTTTQAGLAATGALGWAGTATATIGLATDLVTLGMRSKDAEQLRRELARIPQGDEHAVRKAMTQAMYTRGVKLAISGGVGVASDAIGVAGSLVPVVGLPSNVIALSVAVIRIYAEKGMDKELMEKLKKIVADYEKKNPGLTKDIQAFKDLRKVLENACANAEQERDQAKENYKKEIANYEQLGRPLNLIPRLEEARFELQVREGNLKQTKLDLNECIETSFNLEAYEDARGLIKELDEQAKIEKEQRSIIHYVESEIRKEGSSFGTIKSHLKDTVKSLEKQLHKVEKQRKDHATSTVHDHDTASITEELRWTKAKLLNFNQYPDVYKQIDKLDKKRAKMAAELAAKETQTPITEGHFLTPISVSAHPQPQSTSFHLPTNRYHHLTINTHLRPSGDTRDPLSTTIHSAPSLLTVPSVSRVLSQPQLEKIDSPFEVSTSVSPISAPLLISQPESGKATSPSTSEVSIPELPMSTTTVLISQPESGKTDSPSPSYKPVLPEPKSASPKSASSELSTVKTTLTRTSSSETPPRYLSPTQSSKNKMRAKANQSTPGTGKTSSPMTRKLVSETF